MNTIILLLSLAVPVEAPRPAAFDHVFDHYLMLVEYQDTNDLIWTIYFIAVQENWNVQGAIPVNQNRAILKIQKEKQSWYQAENLQRMYRNKGKYNILRVIPDGPIKVD